MYSEVILSVCLASWTYRVLSRVAEKNFFLGVELLHCFGDTENEKHDTNETPSKQ